MRSDIHAHFLPLEAVAELARPDALRLQDATPDAPVLAIGGRPQALPRGLWDEAALVDDMRRRRLDRRFLCIPPFLFLYEADREVAVRWARCYNDALLALAQRSGGSLEAVGTLPLGHPHEAERELARLAAAGVGMVELATTAAGLELDDDRFGSLWGLAAEAGVVVLLHPHYIGGRYGDDRCHLRNVVGNPFETSFTAIRLACSGLFERDPAPRVVLSHGGGALPYLQGRLDHAAGVRSNVPAFAGAGVLRRFYYDTILFSPAALELLVAAVGADRVAYGTDYPFDMADPEGPEERLAFLGEAAAQQIAGGTAATLPAPAPGIPAHPGKEPP